MSDHFAHHCDAYPFRDLAVGRWPSGGFVVFVRGEVLRERRHGNERVFTTAEAAVRAGQNAR